ncbi:response regulator [Hymenobacter daeguensis]
MEKLLSINPEITSYEGMSGLRVLLAEDNLVNQRIAMIILENWGVDVYAVNDGHDALVQLQQHEFDAALLDIRMPGLSGVEVTRAIRQHPDEFHASVPIIALTASGIESERDAYRAAGMNACLTKPYEESHLCQLLDLLTNIKE